MKIKIISIVFSLILVLTGSAYSENQQIRFRGIEWGSTATDVIFSELSDVRFSLIVPGIDHTIDDDIYGVTHNVEYFYGKASVYYTAYKPKSINVAGYSVDELNLRFAFIPENGVIIPDEDHVALYFANYELSPSDLSLAYEDLTAKLSSIYGEDYEEREYRSYGHDMYRIWKGDDDSAVSLHSVEYPNGSYRIEINYGWFGGNDLLRYANEVYALNEHDSIASNTDGL